MIYATFLGLRIEHIKQRYLVISDVMPVRLVWIGGVEFIKN